MDQFSVVICAYTENRWSELVYAVESVRRQSLAPREIVVVIDHNPSLLRRVREKIDGVVSLENRDERGLSGARNTGVAASQGELIAFMDEDATAAQDWLALLSAGYSGRGVLGVGGSIIPVWQGGRPGWFPQEFDWVVGCTYLGMPQEARPVRNLIGCNMSFRREVFDAVGGFRSGIGRVGTLPFGCEETEFCIRALQCWPQGVMHYEPRARVYHQVPRGRAHWGYFRSRCYFEGRSKALVAGLVGNRTGLASERTYTFQTLPKGVLRALADTVIRQDTSGLQRAGAIVAGLTITTTGYLTGRMRTLESEGSGNLTAA